MIINWTVILWMMGELVWLATKMLSVSMSPLPKEVRDSFIIREK